METSTVTVQAPATVANLVCGYDVLGLCLSKPYDVVEVSLINEKTVIIHPIEGFDLPTDPASNTAGAPLIEMLKLIEADLGFEVKIVKNIKPGSGIGSSAASAAGAVVAANALLGNPFSEHQLVQFAMHGEKIASGVMHADNVAPCIFGGVTLVRSTDPLDVISIPAPDLWVTVVHPQIEIRTADARRILKKQIPLKSAIEQWANTAGLVAGFFKKDNDLIARSLKDVIVEPIRKLLIPRYDEVKSGSIKLGALGGGISGSGPSMFMLSKDEVTATAVEAHMKSVFEAISLPHYTHISKINTAGVTVREN
jgi:homoserine kinase